MSDKPRNNYVSNSAWSLLEKSSRIISGILVGVLVLRYLGDTQYGIIAYGLSIIGIFTIFSTLALDSIVVRELITRKQDSRNILGTAFILRFTGSILVVAASVFYSSLRDPAETTLIVFLLSLSIVFQSLTVIDFYFQAKVQGKFTAINQVITLFLSAIIKLLLIFSHAPLFYFACMAGLEALLTAIFQFYFYHRYGESIRLWSFNLKEAKLLLTFAIPLIISSFIQLLYQNADSILIARFLREMGKVGQYSAGVRISQASYFIPVAICSAVFPGIINNRNNRELQIKRLIQLYSLMFWTAVFIITGAMLFGDFAINFLYGSKYPSAPQIFKIHIWTSLPVYWGTAWGFWMLAEHKQKHIFIMQLINAVLILSADFILIPKLGIQGAAYAVLTGSYFAFLYMIGAGNVKESIYLFKNAINPRNIIEIIRYSRKTVK